MVEKSPKVSKVAKEVTASFAADSKKKFTKVKINLKPSYAADGTKWIRETFFQEGISIESENKETFSLIANIEQKHIARLSYSIFVISVELVKD